MLGHCHICLNTFLDFLDVIIRWFNYIKPLSHVPTRGDIGWFYTNNCNRTEVFGFTTHITDFDQTLRFAVFNRPIEWAVGFGRSSILAESKRNGDLKLTSHSKLAKVKSNVCIHLKKKKNVETTIEDLTYIF